MCWMTVRRGPNCIGRAVSDVRDHEDCNGHSWGLAVAAGGEVFIGKGVGHFPDGLAETFPDAEVALAHTRYATRGTITEPNAHPFAIRTAAGETVAALAHNGTWYAAPDGRRCDSYYIARELEQRYRAAPERDFRELVREVGRFTGETLTVLHRDGRAFAYSGRFEITAGGPDVGGDADVVRSSGGAPIRDGQVRTV